MKEMEGMNKDPGFRHPLLSVFILAKQFLHFTGLLHQSKALLQSFLLELERLSARLQGIGSLREVDG